MSKLATKETEGRFHTLEQRLKDAGLYAGPIDEDWGNGVDDGIAQLFAKAGFKPPVANLPPAISPTGAKWPSAYAWLGTLGVLPRLTVAGGRLLGTKETLGSANSPTIMGWKSDLENVGVKGVHDYTADSVPWCGLGMAKIALDAGYLAEIPTYPLWALNWNDFGVAAKQPCLGSILTFVRDSGGHVATYIAEDSAAYHVLGCNQSDNVTIARVAKSRLKACREPSYQVRPATARPFIVSAVGSLSTNER